MRRIGLILAIIFISGCVSNPAIVPALNGKPRIPINAPVAPEQTTATETETETETVEE